MNILELKRSAQGYSYREGGDQFNDSAPPPSATPDYSQPGWTYGGPQQGWSYNPVVAAQAAAAAAAPPIVATTGPSAGETLAAVVNTSGGGDSGPTTYVEGYESVNPDGTINRYDTQGNFVTTYTSNGSDIVGDFFAGIDSSLGLSSGLTSIGQALEDFDNTLGLSRNAPAIVGLAAAYFLPGIGAALGQSLVNAGVITGAAIPYATTIGTALAQTGVSVAQGKPLDEALTSAIISGGVSGLTQAFGADVKSAISQITTNPVAQNAIFKAGTDVVTAVAQGKTGDQIVQGIGNSIVSTVAGAAANELVKTIPGIDALPDAAKKVVTSGIAASIQGGDGTKSMLNTALREGTNYVLDAATSTPIALGTDGTTGAMQGGFGSGVGTGADGTTDAMQGGFGSGTDITDTLTKTGLQETTPSPVAGIPATTTPAPQGAVTGTNLPPVQSFDSDNRSDDFDTNFGAFQPPPGWQSIGQSPTPSPAPTPAPSPSIPSVSNVFGGSRGFNPNYYAGASNFGMDPATSAQFAASQPSEYYGGEGGEGGAATTYDPEWGDLDAAIAASAKRAWPTNFSDSVAKSLDLFDQLESAGLTSNNGVTTIYDSRTKENLSFNSDTGEFLGKTPAPPNAVVTDPEVQKFLNTIKPNVDAFPIGYKAPTPEAIQNTTPGATKNPIASTDRLVVDMLDSEDSVNRNQPALDTASAAEQNLAALLAFGKTATPPPAGNSYALLGELSGSYGQNIPDYIGNLPFSLVSKDTGTGATSYSNGQGLSLVAYSDGTAKITEDAHPETPITVQLPPEVKDKPEIVLPPATKTIPPTPTPIPVTTPKPPVPPVTPPVAPIVPAPAPAPTPTPTPPPAAPTPAPTVPAPVPTPTPAPATPPPPTSAEVSKIVTDALAANPSLTPKQVAEIVDNAVKAIPLGTTAADVQKIVDAAVKTIPSSPSAQDVSKAVTDATKDLATKEGVGTAITGATKDLATTKSVDDLKAGLTKAIDDAGKNNANAFNAIDKAIEDLKAAGLTEKQVKDFVDTGVGGATKTLQNAIDDAVTGNKKSLTDLQNLVAKDISASETKVTNVVANAETRLGEAIQAAKDIGLKGDAALQSGLNAVAADLGKSKEALLAQLGKTEESLKTQFATDVGAVKAAVETGQAATKTALGELNEAQKKEVADRVAAGQATDAAIAAVKATVETGQAATEAKLDAQGKAFRDALVQQGMDQQTALETAMAAQTKLVTEGQAATKTALGDLSAAQQKEVADRVAAGETTAAAIAAVQTAVETGQAALESKLTAQGKEFMDALVAQGMDQKTALDTAMTAQSKSLTELSTGFTTQLEEAEKRRADAASAWEAQRKLDLTEAEKQRGIDRQAELDRAAAAEKARQTEITNQKAREAANLRTIQTGQLRGQMQTGLQGLIGGLQQQATQMAAPGVVETVKATPGFSFDSPLNVGFFGGYESQKAPTKDKESLKIATGGYLDDLLEAIR